MRNSPEVCCIVCQLLFCCGECRWNHEKTAHGLTYDCPMCRGHQFLCRPEELNQEFIQHILEEHLPLQCKKCDKMFNSLEDLINIDKCTSISELIGSKHDKDASRISEVNAKFDSLYEKSNNNGDSNEGVICVNKFSKTAIITPMLREKNIVGYESSNSDNDDDKVHTRTPYPSLAPKTPKTKRQRAATPHVKKIMSMMRQKATEEYDDTQDNERSIDESLANTETTPLRNENIQNKTKEITTPKSSSNLPNLLKLAQAVTTSTPTHPITDGWSPFSGQGTDSPLSEIENPDSPAQSTNPEPSKDIESVPPKLKSIIITNSRTRLGSQDSSEKHVTFQDSANNTEASSIKKKVKFAEDTVFDQQLKKRVFRKPKRMLTPGPQKPRFCYNPRFQALINRFENQGITMARTPKNNREQFQETTPPVGEPSVLPARAIDFKDDSPVVEAYSKESNEMYKSCIDSPSDVGVNNAITALTTNIAGSLQNCISSVLKTTEEETEIEFKFVITKKKVSVRRLIDDGDKIDEQSSEVERATDNNKENIWSTVAKAIKNVFWGEQGTSSATPFRPYHSNDSTSSSASKRKCEEMSDSDLSPLNHKRHKYEGKIRGRPPLRRNKPCGVSHLRTALSEEQQSLIKSMSLVQEDAMNLSF